MALCIVQKSCRKLRSAIANEATMRLTFTADLHEILRELVAIEAVLMDISAEDYCWLFEMGKCWPTNVNDTAHGICDMVDELQDMTVPAARNKTAKMLGRNVTVEPKSKEIMLARMKEIKEKLKELRKESVEYVDVADRTTLLQAPAAIVGREEDVKKILAQLSACHYSEGREGPIILPICGECGVGKATVAEMVFDDDQFKCYSRIWIHQSWMLDLHEIGNYIISQLVSAGEEATSCHDSNDDMGYITNRLHELLNGKKVLIVLHNTFMLYDHDHSKGLKDTLSVGGIGSTQVIVIATVHTLHRDIDTADIEHFGIQPYRLDPLTDEMCCNIIRQAAVHSQDRSADKEDFELIAPQVAKLCKGIPMSAHLSGNLLQFKQYREWSEGQGLYFPDFQPGTVNTPLQLSYMSMPQNLRLCFAYCAFILMGGNIVKEDLMHQLIALDLIEPSEEFSTLQLAEQYLKRLLDMSLLQTAKSSQTSAKDDTRAISFTMHLFVREFAEVFFGHIWGGWNKWMRRNDRKQVSYALVVGLDRRSLKSIFSDQKIRALRCLHCSKMNLGDDSFSFARHLRVLELHDESSTQKLPESICELRHLGHLKLSGWTALEKLPESIGDLTNLLHIDLSACSRLVNLPESFGELAKLKHINLSGCPKLVNLPESFGKLKKLKHINLFGCLALVNLPGSFGKLTSLVHINLSGCLALVNLPESFGKLTKLEHINLSGCISLVDLPESFGKLANLEHINLSGCLAIVEMTGSIGKLTKLEEINLSGCPKLVNLPETFGKLTNLVHINLSGCSGLSKLPESFGKLRKLSHINLPGCSGLEELPESFGKLISLVHINLSCCSGLAALPGSFGDLQNLLHVDLSRCYGLSKLPESFGKIKKLVHLNLSFWSCFEGIQTALDGLTNLQHLNLSYPCCYRADYHELQGLKEVLSQFVRLKHLNLSMFLNPIFCNQSEKENSEYLEFITDFYRLEYLNLSHSIFLCEIPRRVARLCMLHTLDLSGCIRLKKGEWMGSTDHLRSVVLSHMESYRFVVTDNYNAINNYGHLVDLTCKELEITYLEKMKSAAEAQGIRLAEKQDLHMLKLCWTVSSERAVEDNVLLEELVPPHSLEFLELNGYSSTYFPSWLTSSISSFNLVEVTMDDIPNCSHLPQLGLLPNLQRVVLRRMYSITRLDAGELSGGNTTAFNRLSEFTIEDMSSLEEFTYYSGGGGGGVEFLLPVINELVVSKCPNLSFVPLPPRSRRLVISDCNDVMVCWQNRAGTHGVEGPSCISSTVTEVTELVVENCRVYLSHWCLLNHLPGLRSLTIKNCNNLISLPDIIGVLSSLQTLCFSECNRMIILPENLGGLSSLQELQIKSCGVFRKWPESMEHLSSLQKLTIEGCVSIGHLPKSISKLTNLKDLHRCGANCR